MESDKNQTLPAGSVLRGRVYTYTIERVLGQGAFGITYLASTSMKGPLGDVRVQVALKEFFAKELDSRQEDGTVSARTQDGIVHRYARAFQRESENLSKMKHPGIVNVLEAFESKGTYYYSMEYLSGGSLDEKIKGGGLPEPEALSLIGKIGEALGFMHEQKVMHLDLKPKNIMLKGDGAPVIIDFGLSKQYDSSGEPESSSTIGLGTPGYAPIEQANQTSGRLFQPTLDIYALGATLYKMLTGVTPPPASEILNEGFPKGALLKKSVSQSTIGAIRQAMSATRKDRPQSVGDFLKLLGSPSGAVDVDGDDEEGTIVPDKESGHKPRSSGGTAAPSSSSSSSAGLQNPPQVPSRKPSRKGLWIALASGIAALVLILLFMPGRVGTNSFSTATGSANGHDWVDLGLSVKWATCNVGASSPSDYGRYYAWGETSTKNEYTWTNYQFKASGDSYDNVTFSKYNTKTEHGTVDNKTRLERSEDAARSNWGRTWRIPTDAEWTELRTKGKWTWTTQGGKNGYKVIGPNGNSIFLPAAGCRIGTNLSDAGSDGDYWSSSLSTDYPTYAWRLYFDSGGISGDGSSRYRGFSIRPVSE